MQKQNIQQLNTSHKFIPQTFIYSADLSGFSIHFTNRKQTNKAPLTFINCYFYLFYIANLKIFNTFASE